ncbi:MAG TPA: ABC transporter permease [Devosiaceae bacterium]
MRIRLEKRPEPSNFMLVATPVASVLLTMIIGVVIFEAMGIDGVRAVKDIFLTPLLASYKWQDVAVKAAPLIIIGVGLSVGNRANVWNIGAEGQYIVGALAGAGVGLLTAGLSGWWVLPAIVSGGVLGGMAWAAIPAFLKNRYGVSEILSSLMLTYVALQLLSYLIGGPWKDPAGRNFPQTPLLTGDQLMPMFVPGTTVHMGVPIAVLVALAFWALMSRSVFGFQIRVVGSAPNAARHGGFSARKTVWLALLIGGAMAGLAGVFELTGATKQLNLGFPSGYGFTAIIVSFLGRLHPIGVLIAGIVLAVTYVGGQVAQTTVHIPNSTAGIFQAMMLFFILASDIFVRYRLRIVSGRPAAAEPEGARQ